MSLYEQIGLATEIREHLKLMAVEDEELIADTFEGQTDIYECMDWLLRKIANEATMQEAIAARMTALQKRKLSASTREASWRSILQKAMEATGLKTVKRPEATITLAPKPIGLEVIQEELIPDDYFVIETIRKLDKKKLKEALVDHGLVVAGVTLDNGGISLRIRT